ncbi:MAG: hypothetical protein JXB88_07095 [Spirochaetales bacterium]|nr:hypothetical protein [Spirochaetales bacterium]
MELRKEKHIQNVKTKYEQLSFCLNKKSKRLWAATEANSIGWGGVSIVHEATGIDFKTIIKGIKELFVTNKGNRIRKVGGGRMNRNIHFLSCIYFFI